MTLPRLLLPLAAALVALAPAPASAQDLVTTYRAAADSLIRAATGDSAAYARLARLVDGFGHRHAGSRSLEAAIDWILGEMKKDGLQNVRGEPVQVTHWMRGAESAVLRKPRLDTLHMLGLGGSVGTPKGGITAPVLVVTSFEELEQRRAEARGKIVLFDVPFTRYDETRRYRFGHRIIFVAEIDILGFEIGVGIVIADLGAEPVERLRQEAEARRGGEGNTRGIPSSHTTSPTGPPASGAIARASRRGPASLPVPCDA